MAEAPQIGVAKAVFAAPANNFDGSYTLTYRILVHNSGDVTVKGINVAEDLASTFSGASGFFPNFATSARFAVNPGYNGASNTNLLMGADSLAAGEQGTVDLTLTVIPGTHLGPYSNSAVASGTSAGGTPVTDTSTDGTVPDANGNGDPTDDSVPTPVSFTEFPGIGAAKALHSGPLNNGDGTYTLTYRIRVENTGDVPISAVQVRDDLATTFAGATAFTVDGVQSSDFALNPGFDGSADSNLLTGTDALPTGGSGTLELTVSVTPGVTLGPYENSADASATSAGGTPLQDASADGSVPDANGNGDPADDSTPTMASFTESPGLGIAKAIVSGPAGNGDGTYTLTYRIFVDNRGDALLTQLQVVDDLSAAFAGASAFVVDSLTSSDFTPNPGFDGQSDINLLSATDTMASGASGSIEWTVTVTPDTNLGPYSNSATGSATSAGGTDVADVSTDGNTPDANGNGDATDDADPTFVSFMESPEIGVAKRLLSEAINNNDGTYTLTYRIVVENSGDALLNGVQVSDDLAATFAAASGFVVDSVAGDFNLNAGFDGGSDTNLLAGTDAMTAGASGTIDVTVSVTPGANLGPYANSANASATSAAGTAVADLSTDGAAPDANANGDPSDDFEPTAVTFGESPRIGLAMAVASGPTNHGDGTYSLSFRLRLENAGDVPVSAVQIVNDLSAAFGGASGFTVTAVTSSDFTPNPAYDGVSDLDLLAGTDAMRAGGAGSVDLAVTVTPGSFLGPYLHSASASATSPAGAALDDDSTDGSDPDANGNGDPSDDADPTSVTLSESPEIGVAKSIWSGPANNSDGTYTLTYRIRVENSGDVALDAVQLADDLAATFAGVTGFAVDAVTSPDLTPNPAFDGSSDTILAATDTLGVAAAGVVDVRVTVTPGTVLGPFANHATASATSPANATVTDISTEGAVPDANGNGDPSDDAAPTFASFSEAPQLGVAKWTLSAPANNGDGTYTLTYRVRVENSGDVPLNGVQLADDLSTTFAGAVGFSVDALASSDLAVNPGYDGASNVDLLSGTDVLNTGASGEVELRVTVTPGSNLGPYANSAVGSATSSGGMDISDTSTAGSLPDTNGNGDPSDDAEPTVVSFSETPVFGVAKRVLSGPTNHGDGTYSLTYRLRVVNSGDVPLSGVQLADDLSATFAGAAGFTVDSVASSGLGVNSAFDGRTDTNVLVGTDVLPVGAARIVDVAVTVTPGTNLGPYANSASGTATSTGGATLGDTSTNGANPDPNGNGDPTDDSVSTLVSFAESPQIGIAKAQLAPPINNGDGTYTLTYRIVVENAGDVPLQSVQIDEPLATTFNDALGYTVDAVQSADLTISSLFDGSSRTAVLVGSDGLDPGAGGSVDITVTVTPGADLGPYGNSATASATSVGGTPVSDVSTAGSVPDANGNGDPGDDAVVTNVTFSESPQLGAAKFVQLGPANVRDGTYVVIYRIFVENTGDVPLADLQVVDDLAGTFAGALDFEVPNVTSAEFSLNANYDGAADPNLLEGTEVLVPGASGTIELTLRITPGANLGPYQNRAVASATSPGGVAQTDLSTDGPSPDANGNGSPADDETPTPVTFPEAPQLGAAMALVGGPTNNADGTYTLDLRIRVENSGDVPVHTLQVTSDLGAAFAGATYVVEATSSGDFAVNPAYDGGPDPNLLLGTDGLASGAAGDVDLSVRVTPGVNLGPYATTASATATSTGGASLADIATDGEIPDANGNGDPADDAVPTVVVFTEAPELGVAKDVFTAPTSNGDGTYTLTYRIFVENSGDVPVIDVQVEEDLGVVFAAASAFRVETVTSPDFTPNPAFDGVGNTNLLTGNDVLATGAVGVVDVTVTVTPGTKLGPYTNRAAGAATSVGGQLLADLSTAGTQPDADGDGDPTDDAVPTAVTFSESPQIGVAKAVTAGPVNNGDGTYTLTYSIRVVNSGDALLAGVGVTDDVAAAFAGVTAFTVDAVTASTLSVNPSFDGTTDVEVLAGSDSLAAGTAASVELVVTVTPGPSLGPYRNSAHARATSAAGSEVEDTSATGTVPDANGNGDPTDDSTPTSVTFGEAPQLGAAKGIVSGPTNNGDGTYTLTYRIVVRNSGDVPVTAVQVVDNLATTFGSAVGFRVDAVQSGSLSVNPTFDGSSDARLLTGSDALAVGTAADVDVRVTVTPGSALGPYHNLAVASATSSGGSSLSDVSTEGATPDANGNGDPGDDFTPTRVTFVESPRIGAAKRVLGAPTNNRDGSYTLTYRIVVRNSGDVPVQGIGIEDDLATTFGAAIGFSVDTVTSNDLAVNPAFDGSTNRDVLDGTDSLAPGDSGTVDVGVTVTPGETLGPYANHATARATSAGGTSLDDLSTAGSDPDANGNGDPADDGSATLVVFSESPQVGIVKEIAAGPTNNADGTHTLTYRITVQNSGDVPIAGIQIVDDLDTAFSGAVGYAVDAVASGDFAVDPAFDGATDSSLLAGTDALPSGQSGSVDVTVTVTPGGNLGPYTNAATGIATSAGGAPLNDEATTPVVFTESPRIGVAKAVVATPTSNGDGTYTLTYRIVVQNSGDTRLDAIQIEDDLSVTFATASSFQVQAVSSADFTIHPAFDGTSDKNLLAGTDTLVAGASGSVDVSVNVTPGLQLGPYANSAVAWGTSSAGALRVDTSTAGAVPDANANGDPTDDSVPTSVTFVEAPELGLAKSLLSAPTNNGNGTYTLTYRLRVENSGTALLGAVQVTDDLASAFSSADGFIVESVTSPDMTVNPAFDGATDQRLLAGADALPAGSTATIDLTVTVTPGVMLGPYANSAVASATSAGGMPLSDTSAAGAAADANGNGNPGDDSTPTRVTFGESPQLGAAKNVLTGPINNGDGTYTLTYRVTVENSGDVPVLAVQALDDLSATFGGATSFVVDAVTSADLSINPGFDGNADARLLVGDDVLASGAAGSIDLTVTVTPGPNLGPYANSAVASAMSSGGTSLADLSTAGSIPDANGNGDPGDDDTPTTVAFAESPQLGVAKWVAVDPTNNGDGAYTLTYSVTVENSGDVPVLAVQVLDDLSATFGGASAFVVDGVTSSDFTVNPGFDGSTDTALLSGSDALDAGAAGTVGLTVTVTPGANLGPYGNTAVASATSSGGASLTDASASGTTPDANGNGDPTDDATPTLVLFGEAPQLGLAKRVLAGPTNRGDGTYTLTYRFVVANSGDVFLDGVQIVDDLATTFAGATRFVVDGVTSPQLSVNSAFDGAADASVLAGTDVLGPGTTASVDVVVTVTPGTNLGPYPNTATAQANSAGGTPVSDSSTAGAEPDADGDGDPSNDAAPTTVVFGETPRVGVAKSVWSGPTSLGNGSYALTYRIVVGNHGDVPLHAVQVTDDLVAALGAAGFFSVDSLFSSEFGVNPGFDGAVDRDLLSGTDALATAASGSVDVAVTVTPAAFLGPYANSATAQATSAGGASVSDLSVDGVEPDANGNGDPTDDAAPTTITFTESPELGVAKWVFGAPTNHGNGTYTVEYRILIENSGDVPLHGLRLTDDLGATFQGASSFVVGQLSSSQLAVNPTYDGRGDVELLDGSDSLGPGARATLGLRVTVTPNNNLFYENRAVGTGTSPGGVRVSDLSTDGPDPDADGDGDPTNDDTPTAVTFGEFPVLGVAKRATPPVNNGDGTYRLTYTIALENSGDVPLEHVQAFDDLGSAFASATDFTVESVQSDDFKVNTAYNGSALSGLLVGTDRLFPGERGEVHVTVTVSPGSNLGPYLNAARGAAESPAGANVGDVSADGDTPDANGNGTPRDDSEPTRIEFSEAPGIGVAKAVSAGPTSNGDGTHGLTYTITLQNHGDVQVRGVQVTDSLASTFRVASGYAVTRVSSPTLAVDSRFDGAGRPELLTGGDTLGPGETARIDIELVVTPGGIPGVYMNTAHVRGASPAGAVLADVSSNGTQPDADGNGDPTDDSSPTPVMFDGAARVGLAKRVTSAPIGDGAGAYTLAYTLRVENRGELALGDLQVRDDLGTAFAASAGYTVDAVSSPDFTINPAYDGASDTDLLAGTDSLHAGASGTLEIRVTVRPGAYLGPYDNAATAYGRTPSGVFIEDLSADGVSVDPNGNGDPSDDQGVTRVEFTETPGLGVAKFVQDAPTQNPDGTYSLTYVLVVHNVGDVRLDGVQLTDSLATTFERAADFRVDSVSSYELTPNPGFDGRGDPNLLDGSDSLGAGQFATVELTVTVRLSDFTGPYLNSAAGSAWSPAGKAISDVSTAGPVPDPDGNGNPADNGSPTPVTFPTQDASILVSKSADRSAVVVSDFVGYTVRMENLTSSPQAGIVLRDVLPADFSYVGGSGRLLRKDTEPQPLEPSGSTVLEFGAIRLDPEEVVSLEYRLRVGSGVRLGEHFNEATPYQNDAPVGNTASARVLRVLDPALELTTIVGNVFHDYDGNGRQDPGEPGVPGARLATASGLVVHTDAEGRYHIAGVDAGQGSLGRNFILKVDPASLPQGSRLTTENPRVLHLTPGLLSQIDFGVDPGSATEPEHAVVEGFLDVAKSVQPQVVDPLWSEHRPETHVLGSTTFASGSADLSPQGKAKIALLARRLKAVPNATVVIEGHTDDVPIHTPLIRDNYELSIARARSVMYELIVTHEIRASRLSARGFGPDRPVDPGKTRKARRANRRVEVKIFPDQAEAAARSIVGLVPRELEFRVRVGTPAGAPLATLEVLETLPDGMRYVSGSARIAGAPSSEPRIVDGTELRWSWPASDIDSSLTIVYRAHFDSLHTGTPLVADTRVAWQSVEGDSGASQPLWSEIRLRETAPPKATRFSLQDMDFNPGGADLTPSAAEALQFVAETLAALRDVRVEIQGHTDSGPIVSPRFASHLAFSEARARSVQAQLQALTDLPDSVFAVRGMGFSRPVDANVTVLGRQRNRRVDITVFGYDSAEPAWVQGAEASTDSIAQRVPIGGLRASPAASAVTSGTNGDSGTNGNHATNSDHGMSGNGSATSAVSSTRASAGSVALPWGGRIWVVEDTGEVEPRLDVHAPTDVAIDAGRFVDRVQFNISTNYSAFIRRWEIAVHRGSDEELLLPIATLSGRGMHSRTTIEWSGDLLTGLELVPGDELLYVMRVYDEAENMDQTLPRRMRLVSPHRAPPRDAGASARAQQLSGDSSLHIQAIPVRGGRVQIRGSDVPHDVQLQVEGMRVAVDRDGKFVLDRLLPTGTHELSLTARSASGEEWSGRVNATVKDHLFMVAVADVAVGSSSVTGDKSLIADDARSNGDFFGTGRLAFYLKGKWRGKYRATAHLDTREEELGDLFKNLDRKDPRRLFRRLDPDLHFLTYGDGSTTTADVNSQGRMYGRLDWDRSRLLWGNYDTGLTGTEFAQYNRSLYGALLHNRSVASTAYGEPRVDATAFVSEPQTAFAHNEFLGTGASLYYLQHPDVVEGSEKIWVEVRDRDSARVLENITLERYRDYEIDEVQGRVILRRPLMQVADQVAPSIIRDTPLDGNNLVLMVDYEYLPPTLDADKVTWGARGKVWATERVAAGGTIVQEDRDGQDYQLVGGDVILRSGRGTYLKTEYADSRAGQSGANAFSVDGGLTFQDLGISSTESIQGAALGFEARLDVAEFTQRDGSPQIGGWWKHRDAGFSTTRLATPREREEWGAELLWRATEHSSFTSRWSVEDVTDSRVDRTFSLQCDYRVSRWQLGGEVRHRALKLANASNAASLLGGLHLGADVRPGVNVYAKGQVTFLREDSALQNNLATLGFRTRLGSRFNLMAEGSAGNLGQAARAGVDYTIDPTHELFGTYTLSTDHVDGRRGTLSIGQRKSISNQLRVFTDHQFTHADLQRGFAQSYGLTFSPRDDLSIDGTYQRSDIDDETSGAIDRDALSLSMTYQKERARITLKGEFRDDGGSVDRRQWLTTNRFDLAFHPAWTLLGKASFSRTDDRTSDAEDAQFVESGVGLAYRPVRHGRLNALGRYTFLFDLPAASQSDREDQRSHVASLDAGYDISRRWELGGRFAHKRGEVRELRDSGRWIASRSNLGIVRARFHWSRAWDAIGEYRALWNDDTKDREHGSLVAVYRHIAGNLKVGAGFNGTSFSDDLTDLDYDSYGWFLRLVGKY